MPDTDPWLRWQPRMLSVLRIVVGLLYMQHGLNKLFDFPPSPTHVPYLSHALSLVPGLAGPLEAVGGLLVALGLFTRWAAFILSGEMAVAYFMVHARRSFFPFVGGPGANLEVLYCFVFFYLFVAGGGPWSLDRLRTRTS